MNFPYELFIYIFEILEFNDLYYVSQILEMGFTYKWIEFGNEFKWLFQHYFWYRMQSNTSYLVCDLVSKALFLLCDLR